MLLQHAQSLSLKHEDDPLVLEMVRCSLEWLTAVQEKREPRWLSLLGPCGTGKTHVAKKLFKLVKGGTNRYEESEFYPSFIHWPALVDDLRGGERHAEFRDMRQWPFLFLDDIMAERDLTGFASEKLTTLLSCRPQKWTVITSNLSLDAIADSETRIADRMLRDNGIVVDVRCKSYAMRTRLEGGAVSPGA